MSFRLRVKAQGKTGIHAVEIDDVIEPWGSNSAKAMRAALKPTRDAAQLNVYINSAGGEVTEGLAIYNMLASHPAQKTVEIGGIAASMASVIAMCGEKIVMPQNSWMMIHNPWSGVMGEADDMRKTADLLDKFRDQLASIYVARTGLPLEDVLAAMAEETWMSGDEALALGYCTEVSATTKAVARLDARRFNNAPKALLRDKPKGIKMDPQLLAALGLPDDATLEDVLAAIKLCKESGAQDSADDEPDADDEKDPKKKAAAALRAARALAASNREQKRDNEIADLRKRLDDGEKDKLISAHAKKFTPATEKLARTWPLAVIAAFVKEAPDLDTELTAPVVVDESVALLAKKNAGVPTEAQLAVWKALGKNVAEETEKLKKAMAS